MDGHHTNMAEFTLGGAGALYAMPRIRLPPGALEVGLQALSPQHACPQSIADVCLACRVAPGPWPACPNRGCVYLIATKASSVASAGMLLCGSA